MSGSGGDARVPPFPPEYRASGLLLHVTSLPSPYGIGDLGPSAWSWIDRLHEAGQQWWQALPVGPTGYGNSPYQSISAFAGNALLISPECLVSDELLQTSDLESDFLPDAVEYSRVTLFKNRLLEKAWNNFRAGQRDDLRLGFEEFCASNASWLEDYALFRALKSKHGGAYYLEWPIELVQRKPRALADARRELASQIDQVRFAQFLLFRQADRLKDYAHSKGVALIGDLPFFVSPDSSDVWANSEFFLLDEHRHPRFVAGVPPDYFSAEGQLWGNPVYNWDALRATGYRWCIDRLRALLAHVDLIRLDHFRGFAAWHVPAGAPTAKSGQWVPGPAAPFFKAVQQELGQLPFIAEDLGVITPDVQTLRDQFQIPGTKILQFAFDGHLDNPYLPGNFIHNTVVYTGTHDNATTREWYEESPADQRQNLWSYLNCPAEENAEAAAPALISLAWVSPAALAMAPLQDVLNLGSEARMNVPGHADGNWRWRFTEEKLSPPVFQWLHELTASSKRLPR
jgi:4-alpha-glucanotransferase